MQFLDLNTGYSFDALWDKWSTIWSIIAVDNNFNVNTYSDPNKYDIRYSVLTAQPKTPSISPTSWNTEYTLDTKWAAIRTEQKNGYVFWFPNEQSIRLTYTMPICIYSTTGIPYELEIEENEIFSFITHKTEEIESGGFMFKEPEYLTVQVLEHKHHSGGTRSPGYYTVTVEIDGEKELNEKRSQLEDLIVSLGEDKSILAEAGLSASKQIELYKKQIKHYEDLKCKDNDVKTKNNQVDIGVRVELPRSVTDFLTNELYESIIGDLIKEVVDLKKEIPVEDTKELIDSLDVDDYYTTDIHWKQENLEKVKIVTSKVQCDNIHFTFIKRIIWKITNIFCNFFIINSSFHSIVNSIYTVIGIRCKLIRNLIVLFLILCNKVLRLLIGSIRRERS